MSETGAPVSTDGAFLIKRALRLALSDALRRTRLPGSDLTLLDVGGRGRPYAGLVAECTGKPPAAIHHFVLDPGASGADVACAAELLPVATGAAGMVLCTQVLEHVEDPAAAVGEMRRVLRPGGVCVLSTHGTWFYHPDPQDYWRWTSAGLARLFSEAGFETVTVTPVGGTRLSLAVLALTTLDRSLSQGLAGGLVRRLLIAPGNRLLWSLLKTRVTGRASQAGELVIDYIVVGSRPQ